MVKSGQSSRGSSCGKNGSGVDFWEIDGGAKKKEKKKAKLHQEICVRPHLQLE